jgi:hypothetical protein
MTNVFVENITTQVEIEAGYDLFEVVIEDFDQAEIRRYAEEAAISAAEALASEEAAADSADAASASEIAASGSATSASNSASSATASASTATTQAGIATTQAGIATTQAGIATTKANEASASAAAALASENDAETAASTATTQAGIATTQAGIATTKTDEASTSASNALTSANTATTQAGIATTQAGNALTSANNAAASAVAAANSASQAAQVGTSTPLTGFTVGANSTIASTDTILQAFGKTQGQINARVSGTIATGQVAFGTAANTVGGDAGFTWNNTTKILDFNGVSTYPKITFRANSLTSSISEIGRRGSAALYMTQIGAFPIEFDTSNTLRWSILSTGQLQSNGAQTIQTSTGNLTLSTAAGNGNIVLSPNGTGAVGVGTATPSGAKLDILGNLRVRRDVFANQYLDISSDGGFSTLLAYNGGSSTVFQELIFASGHTASTQERWRITSVGILQSNGAQTIRTSTGNLTLATAAGNGNIVLSPNGTGVVSTLNNVGIGVSTLLAGSGPILTTTLTNGGSGYVDGTYVDVPVIIISTNGLGALFTVVVSGGVVTTTTLTWAGVAYKVGDTISISPSSLGGSGSGLVITVNTVDSSQLTIAGATGGDITLYRNDTSIVTGDNIGTIKWAGNDTSLKASGYSAEIGAFGANSTGGANLLFFTSNGSGASLTEGFRLTNLSNLHIGTFTADSGQRLQVRGTSLFTGTATFSVDAVVNGVNIGRGGGNIDSNTRIGSSSLNANTTGTNNTFVGSASGAVNSTGSDNSFFGRASGNANTTGINNSFFGLSSGSNNITGNNNSFFGRASGFSSTGSFNIFIGSISGFNISSGSNNTLVGTEAGRYTGAGTTAMTSIDNSIYLGYRTRGLNATGSTNEIVIGYDVVGLGSNTTVLGNSSTTFGRWFGNLLLGTSTNGASPLRVVGLPTSATGLSAGDVWSDGGTLKIA